MNNAHATVPIRRKPLVGLLLVLPVLVVLGNWLALREVLPPTVATHWSGSMLPDGFSSTRSALTTCLLLGILAPVLGLPAFAVRSTGWRLALLFSAGLAGWTAASSWVVMASTTALAGDPAQARLGAWLVVLIAGTLLGIAPAWASGLNREYTRAHEYRRQVRIAQGRGTEAPAPLPVADTAFRTTVNAPLWVWLLNLPLLLVLLVALVLPFALGDWDAEDLTGLVIGWAVLLICLPLLVGMCRISVRVDEQGLRVSSAVLGFTLRRIRLDQIIEVATEQIRPTEWGGWGWRFFPGGSAIVFKAMDGLVVHTVNGKRFALTMPGSEVVRDQLLARKAAGADGQAPN